MGNQKYWTVSNLAFLYMIVFKILLTKRFSPLSKNKYIYLGFKN